MGNTCLRTQSLMKGQSDYVAEHEGESQPHMVIIFDDL